MTVSAKQVMVIFMILKRVDPDDSIAKFSRAQETKDNWQSERNKRKRVGSEWRLVKALIFARSAMPAVVTMGYQQCQANYHVAKLRV